MFCFENVGFRPVEERDLEQIRSLRNLQSTWEQLGGVDHITTEQQKAWYDSLRQSKDRAYYTIFENRSDDTCGVCAYEGDFLGVIRTDEIDYQNRSIRIGLDIVPGKRGQGWGTKAYKALLKWLFDHRNFHRCHLAVLDTNEIGIRLYENVGFKREGSQRQAIWRNGQWHDYILMSILEDEYRK